jgi:hypothetical protein
MIAGEILAHSCRSAVTGANGGEDAAPAIII